MHAKISLPQFLLLLVSLMVWAFPAHGGQAFSATATVSGDITQQTIKGRVEVASSDIGNPGAVFVVASLPTLGIYYHGADGSWLPTPQTYSRGVLASIDVGIVESPMDLSTFGGAKIYVGYVMCPPVLAVSQCFDRMNNAGTVGLVHSIPLKGKIVVTPYTQPSTDGSVAPLASVGNAKGQKITYWGLKDASGTPFAITETLFDDPMTVTQTRTLYGSHGLPKKIISQKAGNTVIIRWGLSNGEFRLYDADRKFVVGINMTVDSSGNVATAPLANDGIFADDPDDFTAESENELKSLPDKGKAKAQQLFGWFVDKAVALVKNGTKVGVAAACGGNPECWAVLDGIVLGTIAPKLANNGGASETRSLSANLQNLDNPDIKLFSCGADRRSSACADSQPQVMEDKPQITSNDKPSVQRADARIVQALAQSQGTTSPALSNSCSSGMYLSKLTNLCEVTPICAYGWVSDDKGYCIRADMCTAPNVLQNGQCITPTPTCTAPQVLKNGLCVTPTPTCTAPQVLQNGQCVTPTPTCYSPQVLQNGQCVTPTPTCYAPQVLQNGVCATPGPSLTGSITVKVEDACNDGYSVQYKFFDRTNNLTYPSASASYQTQYENQVYTHTLSCVPGATIALGAQTGNMYWGVGLSNTQACSSCGYTCDGRTYQTYRFGCSSGTTTPASGNCSGNDVALLGIWKSTRSSYTVAFDGCTETDTDPNGCVSKYSYTARGGLLTATKVSDSCGSVFSQGSTVRYSINGTTLNYGGFLYVR